MLAGLSLVIPTAVACEWVQVDVEDDARSCEGKSEGAPTTVIRQDDPRRRDLVLRYGMQFLPEAPAHQLYARMHSERDAYLGAELRYMPASDVLWTARLGAGFDVLGGSAWDFTLGLWLGSAGEWERVENRATLYSAPIAGTEIGLGFEGRYLFAKYRWLAGIGGGPIDEMLTENEFTIGFKALDKVHIYGQYLRFNPGEYERRSGVGLGVRAVL